MRQTMQLEYEVRAEQDDIPVRGNALASGNDAEDRAAENEILARLERGDIWAWAHVTVIARFGAFEGRASLGACSYRDADDFTQPGGYYDDMKGEAVSELRAEMANAAESIAAFVKEARP